MWTKKKHLKKPFYSSSIRIIFRARMLNLHDSKLGSHFSIYLFLLDKPTPTPLVWISSYLTHSDIISRLLYATLTKI